MSSFTEPRIYTYTATEAIAAYLFAILVGDQTVEQCDGAGELMTGITMSIASQANEAIEIALPGGGAKLLIAGTVTRDQFIKTDANGKGVAVAADGDFYGARAMASGVAGDIIPVEVMTGYFWVTA